MTGRWYHGQNTRRLIFKRNSVLLMHEQKNDGAANIPVGQPIALLAEEGDDISNLESPKESSAEVSSGSSSQSAPATPEQPKPSPKEAPKQEAAPKTTTSHHSHSGLLPSVQRLLASSNLDLSKVKATGKSGRYTKGDILAALGQASSSTGTYTSEREKSITHIPIWGAKDRPVGASTAKKESKPLDARALRGLIIKGMSASYAVPQKKQEGQSIVFCVEVKLIFEQIYHSIRYWMATYLNHHP